MYDEEYAEKCKRLDNIIDEYWSILSYELQDKIKKIREDYS